MSSLNVKVNTINGSKGDFFKWYTLSYILIEILQFTLLRYVSTYKCKAYHRTYTHFRQGEQSSRSLVMKRESIIIFTNK